MAFGINRQELAAWKEQVARGEDCLPHSISGLTDRFPGITSVTKVGCADLDRLEVGVYEHGLDPRYIDLSVSLLPTLT